MHTMRMPYVSIVGSAGYTGQETLDRVLRASRPRALRGRLRLARGQDATALDPRLNRNGGKRVPRLITNAAALACEADITFLCLSHEEAAALEPPSRGVVVDLSGAHRLTDPAAYERVVRVHPSAARGARRLVVRAARAVGARGAADREPGVLRDGRAARARAARGRDRPGERGRRRHVGHDRRGTLAAALDARRASSWRTSRRTRSARTSTSPEIAQLLGFPVSFTPHLLPVRRGLLATCNVRSTGADLRELLEEHYAVEPRRDRPSRGRRAGALPRAVHRRRRDRRLRRPLHRPDDRRSARSTTSARGRPGRRSRTSNVALRALRDGGPAALRGARLMSVTAARASPRPASPPGSAPPGSPTSRSSARSGPRSAARCGRGTGSRPRP